MDIKITNIEDPGVAGNERLVMNVIVSCDVGRYIIFDTKETSPTQISSNPKNVYWFPDREVKSGDKIVLYTKSGIDTQKKNDDGTTTFFFYWGKQSVLWSASGEGAALLKIESFEFKSRI